MPNPNAIVSAVIRLDPPLDRPAAELLRTDRGISVVLEGGRQARLEPSNPGAAGFAHVLDALRQQRQPAYLEIDPATSSIIRVLIPYVTRVVDVSPSDDGLDVEIELSHARHVLRRGSPDFVELERALRDSMNTRGVIVLTEDDAHLIIDVRAFTPGPDTPLPPLPPFPRPRLPKWPWPLRWIIDFWRWPWWPWWWFSWRCMSATRAQQVFNAMAATSCNPLTIPSPCIPFMYPDDGCWGRAHEMCRLMIQMNVSPRKVWIQKVAPGLLHVNTKNNPACFVEWFWHVAPTICVRRWWWWYFWAREMVIDPSMFTTPVSKATWKAAQNNPGATLTDTDWTDFLFGATDPTFTQTNTVLANHRVKLQQRSQGPSGPPPYAHCP